MKGISAVICCYNSALRLPGTLGALGAQRAIFFDWEVLLVDNASTDDTASIAGKLWLKNNTSVPLTILSERQAGLSYARKTGVLAARFDYVIFCDDDNWLNENYLARAFRFMEEHADVGVLGGKGIPYPANNLPQWFEIYQKTYAVGPQTSSSSYLEAGQMLYGAGMVVRRAPLKFIYDHGFHSFLSDRTGNDLVSGGDNELCIWYRLLGFKLYYWDELSFQHVIPAERLNTKYLEKRNFAKGKTEAILLMYRDIANAGFSVPWVDTGWRWYWEIVKRCLYLLFYRLNPRRPLPAELKSQVLSSSIAFRLRNRIPLKEAKVGIIALLGETMKRRDA